MEFKKRNLCKLNIERIETSFCTGLIVFYIDFTDIVITTVVGLWSNIILLWLPLNDEIGFASFISAIISHFVCIIGGGK